MNKRSHAVGIEINPKLIGVLLTERIGNTLRMFCFYTSGCTSQFDVPAEENRDNRHELFSSLNVEATCSSVILDEAVQGRIYAQSENQHWLYTLLISPGNRLPLNADIGDLPWQVIWRSQEMEALQYRATEGAEPSFALRSRLTEDDALRLVKNSKSFTNPVSPLRKPPHRWLLLNIALVLVALAVVVTATVFYTFKQNHNHTSRPAPALNTKNTAPATPTGSSYFLLYNRQISGPYPTKVIADMNAAGLFNRDTMCRTEASTEWVKLATVFPPKTPNTTK
jgi:GYF domain 2